MKRLLLAFSLLVALSASAQSIDTISPPYGPGNVPFRILGTGFTATGTRFVDSSGADIFKAVACTSPNSCTASAVSGLVADGQVTTLSVFPSVNGVRGPVAEPFVYYGHPVLTGATPTTIAQKDAPRPVAYPLGSTTVTVAGSAFPSAAKGLPGSVGLSIQTNSAILTTGCVSSTTCKVDAPNLDCCALLGSYPLTIETPGGTAVIMIVYGNAPATPVVSTVSPTHVSASGGQVVTVTGTNFSTVAGAMEFTFGGQLAAGIDCASTTICTMETPAGNAGDTATIAARVVKPSLSASAVSTVAVTFDTWH